MSVETDNDDFCTNCKVNLGQGQKHSEACTFLQKAEKERIELEAKSNKAIQEAKDELEAKIKNDKEKITKDARAQLEKEIADEKKKKKDLLKKKDDDTKLKFIEKILKFLPEETDVTAKWLQAKTLDELMKFYRKIIKLHVTESKKIFEITCPKCMKHLGKTVTHDDAVKVLKNHKTDCPKMKNSNLGKWLLVGLVFSMIAGSIAFVSSNPHILKKGKKDNGSG